jgi:hypothetical protein
MKIDELNNRIHLGNSGTSPVQNPTVNIPGMPNIQPPISPTLPNPAPISNSPYSASDPIMLSDLFEQALKDNAKQALRYNEGKLQWSMIDFKSLEGMVRVLEMGARKYSKDNWKLGMPVTQVCESLMRHLFAYMSGEDTDPESGESHMSHVLVNAMFVEYIMKERSEFDDRKKN